MGGSDIDSIFGKVWTLIRCRCRGRKYHLMMHAVLSRASLIGDSLRHCTSVKNRRRVVKLCIDLSSQQTRFCPHVCDIPSDYLQWRNYVGSALRQTFPRRPTDFSERELTSMYARPSFVCLLSITFVHRTQSVEIFGNVSTSFGTLAIL